MFNLVYKEHVQQVTTMNWGMSIGVKGLNIFCYADNILLASTTITGIQVTIDACPDYAQAHGLISMRPKPPGEPSKESHILLQKHHWCKG